MSRRRLGELRVLSVLANALLAGYALLIGGNALAISALLLIATHLGAHAVSKRCPPVAPKEAAEAPRAPKAQ